MGSLGRLRLRRGDVVAVALPQGPPWVDVVAELWAARAAILPVDERRPRVRAFLERARPTIVIDEDGARRVDGEPTDAGVALIVPSSGTTGPPKLVELERRAVEAAVAGSAERLGVPPGARWLCCLPLAYVGGLLVLLRGVVLGSPVAVHPRFEPAALDAEPDIAYISLVPAMLARLLNHRADLARFRTILVGGSSLPQELRERARSAGASVVETYGLAESCGGVVYDGLPLAGTSVRVVGGLIRLRGPTVMAGYRLDPDATATALAPDGWLRTSDLGELGPDGRLHVLGRSDDVIVTGGEKVRPTEVETALRAHVSVRQVAVAGREDPTWGQRVVAWVVPADPTAPPTLEELRTFAARSLPRHALPRELVLVEALPATSAGKVRRAALPPD